MAAEIRARRGENGLNMLSCREVTDHASDFLDTQLPLRVRLQLRMHLLMCRFCREYVRQMLLVVRALRRMPPHEAPPERLAHELAKAFNENRL